MFQPGNVLVVPGWPADVRVGEAPYARVAGTFRWIILSGTTITVVIRPGPGRDQCRRRGLISMVPPGPGGCHAQAALIMANQDGDGLLVVSLPPSCLRRAQGPRSAVTRTMWVLADSSLLSRDGVGSFIFSFLVVFRTSMRLHSCTHPLSCENEASGPVNQ